MEPKTVTMFSVYSRYLKKLVWYNLIKAIIFSLALVHNLEITFCNVMSNDQSSSTPSASRWRIVSQLRLPWSLQIQCLTLLSRRESQMPNSILTTSSHKLYLDSRSHFFWSPLLEIERRRFLSECSRSSESHYNPPPINSNSVYQTTKRFDAQLADIQFRLSGITRLIDWFLHNTLRNNSVSPQECHRLRQCLHELLLDSASHITHLRIDNMSRGAGIQGQAPRLAESCPVPLLDLKVMLDHVQLSKSVAQMSRRNHSRHHRGRANSSNGTVRSENAKSDYVANNQFHKHSNENHKKGFRNGNPNTTKGNVPKPPKYVGG